LAVEITGGMIIATKTPATRRALAEFLSEDFIEPSSEQRLVPLKREYIRSL
jgi:hypothetical protein